MWNVGIVAIGLFALLVEVELGRVARPGSSVASVDSGAGVQYKWDSKPSGVQVEYEPPEGCSSTDCGTDQVQPASNQDNEPDEPEILDGCGAPVSCVNTKKQRQSCVGDQCGSQPNATVGPRKVPSLGPGPVIFQTTSPVPIVPRSTAPVHTSSVTPQPSGSLPVGWFGPCVPTMAISDTLHYLIDQLLPEVSLPVSVANSGYQVLTVSCSVSVSITYHITIKLEDKFCYDVQLDLTSSVSLTQLSPVWTTNGSSPMTCPKSATSFCQL